MKKLIALSTVVLVAFPFAASALTIRTDHRSSTGGMTVTEGGASASGNESSSVSVQNVISGTRGHVEVTTTKDGVTTTESHDINGGTSVIVTPTPSPEPTNGGRTPREPRGAVAVQSTQSVNVSTGGQSHSAVHTSLNPTPITSKESVRAGISVSHSKLAVAGSASHINLGSPVLVSSIDKSGLASLNMSSSIEGFIAKIFSFFGLSA